MHFPGGAKLLTIVVVALMAVGSLTLLVPHGAGSFSGPVPTGFNVNGKSYHFNYTATTDSERQAGLMNRRVTSSTTMLFAFPASSEWQFWMYDTNTSLDMIWVNATGGTGRVVYVVSGASPCLVQAALNFVCARYTPNSPANFVIEAKAGFASSNGIVYGTTLTFT